MTAHPLMARLLLYISVPLGLVSAGFSIYFGIDVVEQWLRPAPPPSQSGDHPIEVVARGVGAVLSTVNSVGDAISRGLFYASLVALAVALGLFFLSRKLNGST